jgi:hypothetical protein
MVVLKFKKGIVKFKLAHPHFTNCPKWTKNEKYLGFESLGWGAGCVSNAFPP